jgi:hypothetical protein
LNARDSLSRGWQDKSLETKDARVQAQEMVASATELKVRGEAMLRSSLGPERWRHKGKNNVGGQVGIIAVCGPWEFTPNKPLI